MCTALHTLAALFADEVASLIPKDVFFTTPGPPAPASELPADRPASAPADTSVTLLRLHGATLRALDVEIPAPPASDTPTPHLHRPFSHVFAGTQHQRRAEGVAHWQRGAMPQQLQDRVTEPVKLSQVGDGRDIVQLDDCTQVATLTAGRAEQRATAQNGLHVTLAERDVPCVAALLAGFADYVSAVDTATRVALDLPAVVDSGGDASGQSEVRFAAAQALAAVKLQCLQKEGTSSVGETGRSGTCGSSAGAQQSAAQACISAMHAQWLSLIDSVEQVCGYVCLQS